jgi:hypothetical protein
MNYIIYIIYCAVLITELEPQNELTQYINILLLFKLRI